MMMMMMMKKRFDVLKPRPSLAPTYDNR